MSEQTVPTPSTGAAVSTVSFTPAAAATIDVPAAIVVGEDGLSRCRWGSSDPEMLRYHDEEWGRPLHGDQPLYEKMCLEGFQAGLSWITILKRRAGFRSVFHGFDPALVSQMTE